MTGGDRLIVALDVPSVETAHAVVDELSNVRSYKIGWRLLMAGLRAGGLAALWERIADDGKRIPMELSAGDRVIYSKFAGTEYKDGDDEYLILRESDILAKIS